MKENKYRFDIFIILPKIFQLKNTFVTNSYLCGFGKMIGRVATHHSNLGSIPTTIKIIILLYVNFDDCITIYPIAIVKPITNIEIQKKGRLFRFRWNNIIN